MTIVYGMRPSSSRLIICTHTGRQLSDLSNSLAFEVRRVTGAP